MVAPKKQQEFTSDTSFVGTFKNVMALDDKNGKPKEKSSNQDFKSQQNLPKASLNQTTFRGHTNDSVARQYISPHTQIQDHTGQKCVKRKSATQKDPDEPKLVYGRIVLSPPNQVQE